MTTVTTTTTPATGNPGNLPTLPAFTKISRILRDRVAHWPAPKADPLARQQAIENALSMALYHVRNGDTTQAIHTATAKAVRAVSMLKQACSEANMSEVAA